MGSKGAHTLIEALIQLQQQGISVQASLAGDSFQNGYREQLEEWLTSTSLMVRCSLSASWDDKPWLVSMPCITLVFSFHPP